MIKAANLSAYPACRHFFLNRYESAEQKYKKIFENALRIKQEHSGTVFFIDKSDANLEGDGLITKDRNYLAILTADCLPLFFYHPKKRIIAAIHAGWRGLSKGIIENTLEKFSRLSALPEDLIVAIGPHIGVCCYQVGPDLIDIIKTKYPRVVGIFKNTANDTFFDLSTLICQILITNGVNKANIEDTQICTSCSVSFHSYRRNKTSGRNLNLIGLI